tara:strand:+ start:11730 stop:12101 length:372 start_codon:yes stop_codon:yes gene_type:complete
MKNKKLDYSSNLLKYIIEGMQEMKGVDITIMDLRKIETSVCNYFVICSGTSNTHTSSIGENIRKNVSKKIAEKPWNIEGFKTSEWILIDYSDIVVHVFQQHTRFFYDLEDLWGDAKITNIEYN